MELYPALEEFDWFVQCSKCPAKVLHSHLKRDSYTCWSCRKAARA